MNYETAFNRRGEKVIESRDLGGWDMTMLMMHVSIAH